MPMFAAILLACNPVVGEMPLPTPPVPTLPPPTEEEIIHHEPAPVDVTVERLGEAETAALTGQAEVLTHANGSLALLDALLEPQDLGLFAGVLGKAARLPDGTLLIERDEELWTYDGDWRSTPLDSEVAGLVRWLDLPEAVWIEDVQGLRRFDGTFFGLTLDGEPIRSPWAVGGEILGTDAVWAAHAGLVVGITERQGGWTPLDLHQVEAWDLAVDREGWVVVAGADGLVHLRDPITETWSLNSLPETVNFVLAHPRGEAVWLRSDEGWYVWLDGLFLDAGSFGSAAVEVDALGRLIRTTDGVAERISVTRPVQIVGIEPDEVVATERAVAIAPTAPDRVVSVSATVFGASHPVSDRPWTVEIDPLVQPDGNYTFEIEVTYDDGQIGTEAVAFWVGDPVIPTWSVDVLPIHQDNCSQCHNGDVQTILDSREAWEALSQTILEQVQSQAMPLGGPPLADTDIATIRSWRNAGFPP